MIEISNEREQTFYKKKLVNKDLKWKAKFWLGELEYNDSKTSDKFHCIIVLKNGTFIHET